MSDSRPLIVALDFQDEKACRAVLEHLDPARCRVKIGKELFTRAGPALVKQVVDDGFDVFLDLKFHDIPNTTAAALRAAADLGVWMVNVHASGGPSMLEASRRALEAPGSPLLIAVTVLTSLEDKELTRIGVSDTSEQQVMRLARLSAEAGLDGVVCSAHETMPLRSNLPSDFCLVTPGIRPAGSGPDDQKRIETPASALLKGSDYLVVGRPVTQAEDPAAVVEGILAEISGSR